MRKLFFVFILSVFQSVTSNAQTSDLEKELLVWFDTENDVTSSNLINGVEVVETLLAYKDSHKYYKSPYFVSGSINYLDQNYYNVLMMYNIFEDKVIIKFNEGKRTSIIQLMDNEVKSFSLLNTHFDRLKFNDNNGFFELIKVYSKFKLYKKHKKYTVAKTNTGKSTVRHEFVKAKDVFVIEYGTNYSTIESKNDLYDLFPNIKREIKNMFNKDKEVQSAWRKKEMENVFKQIENLLPN
ncbi:hypothetical protein MWU58_09400 [Flavobacteriaceae bacterium S0825]|uniref:hypothetical protein n=1 Tax=Gaetbulibacter sp. S0825 TaxID=2720084 RepID=UPI00142FEAFC|nr:hypothetical protein [Gaetbulibacter sp. S0825]MCK0109508.1 hypothetical protein [Flavobacteriaceae bacterium S0825]NIX65143.1 hypothetical protein [Gaetbulibacter sp. S0825]